MDDEIFFARKIHNEVFVIPQIPSLEEAKKVQQNKEPMFTFRRYLKQLFRSSLIPSVPEIANSRSCIKMVWKTGVFMVCLIGFTYQMWDFLNYYYTYPIVLHVEEKNILKFPLPAFTFCSNNRISRIAYCEKYKTHCKFYKEEEKDKFCVGHPQYCSDGSLYEEDMAVLKDDYPFSEGYEFDWKEAEELTPTANVFDSCYLNYDDELTPCGYDEWIHKVPFTTERNLPTFCTTIRSVLNKPTKPYEKYTENFYRKSLNVKMSLNAAPEDYFFFLDSVYMYATVHSRKQSLNPFRFGQVLLPGYHYEAEVSLKETEKLPYPYITNCTDYAKTWKENKGKGPLTQWECVEFCKLNTVLSLNKCVDSEVAISHKEKLCDTYVSEWTKTTTVEIIEDCNQKCQPGCIEQIYEVKYRGEQRLHSSVNGGCIFHFRDMNGTREYKYGQEWCKLKIIRIHFSFRHFNLKREVYQAKFESVELFSYVGGYLSFWLGISLVSMMDFVELLGKILLYPLRKQSFKSTNTREI